MIFTPSKNNPILKPDPKIPWASLATYNPTVIYENKTYHLFYRTLGQAFVSKIDRAVSRDGVNFKRDREPDLKPELKIEKYGIEDPRIARIDKTYYLTYTAYDRKSARLCLATSPDLIYWHRHGLMLSNWDFTKAGGFSVNYDSAQKTPEAKTDWSKAVCPPGTISTMPENLSASIGEKIGLIERYSIFFGFFKSNST